MRFELTEADFRRELGDAWVDTRLLPRDGVLDDESIELDRLMDGLPTVVRRRIERSLPPGMRIFEIQLELELAGKPFGIGLGGSISVVLRGES